MAVNKMVQERARVLLADDHPAVAKELCALLQTEFDVIATVGDGEALLAAAHALDQMSSSLTSRCPPSTASRLQAKSCEGIPLHESCLPLSTTKQRW